MVQAQQVAILVQQARQILPSVRRERVAWEQEYRQAQVTGRGIQMEEIVNTEMARWTKMEQALVALIAALDNTE